jgi:hypothetical protein
MPPPAVSILMQILMMLQLTPQLSDNAAELAVEVRKPLEKKFVMEAHRRTRAGTKQLLFLCLLLRRWRVKPVLWLKS